MLSEVNKYLKQSNKQEIDMTLTCNPVLLYLFVSTAISSKAEKLTSKQCRWMKSTAGKKNHMCFWFWGWTVSLIQLQTNSHHKLLSKLSLNPSAFYTSYHSNSWRQQQISGGHNSEVGNVDQHITDSYQRDANEDSQWQVPEMKWIKIHIFLTEYVLYNTVNQLKI